MNGIEALKNTRDRETGDNQAEAFLGHWGDRLGEVTAPVLGGWFSTVRRDARIEAVVEHRERLRDVPHEHVWVWENENLNGPCATSGCGSGSQHEVCDVCGLERSTA